VPELSDPANAPDAFVQFANSVDALIGIPVGAILPFAGVSAPTGWFLCNGAEVSAATNPKLAALLGTNFGAASSGMVKLPDLRGRFPIGTESGQSWAIGAKGGAAQVTLTQSNLPSHTHSVSIPARTGTTASADASHSHAAGALVADGAGAYARSWNISTGTNGVSSVETFAKVDVARDGGNRTPITLNLSIPNHTHTVSGSTAAASAPHTHTFDIPASTATTDGGSGTGAAVNVMPPYLAVGFIIKGG
jgi:microcystin-dependent protein